jgi:hypothetical protein
MPKLGMREAQRVSRLLSLVAPRSRQPEAIENLARAIWALPKFVLDGERSSLAEGREFLMTFGPYFPAHECQAVIDFLKTQSEDDVGPRTVALPQDVEYRPFTPALYAMTSLRPRRAKKKWPADDLTERVCAAHSVLERGRCKRPTSVIVELLEREGILESCYCTHAHVESRLKVFSDRNLDSTDSWVSNYLLNLDATQGFVAPERIRFDRCDC